MAPNPRGCLFFENVSWHLAVSVVAVCMLAAKFLCLDSIRVETTNQLVGEQKPHLSVLVCMP